MSTHMEHAASTLGGAAKQIRAAEGGLSGVFKTLTQEHTEASALLLRLSESSDPDGRRRLFPLIRKELLSHEKAELAVIYPVYAQHEQTLELAIQHNREAQTMEGLIERLHALDVESERWASTLDALVKALQRHVAEEENHFFPMGEYTWGREKARELDVRYKATRNEIAAHL
jgi:hemerythrin superfamily protein